MSTHPFDPPRHYDDELIQAMMNRAIPPTAPRLPDGPAPRRIPGATYLDGGGIFADLLLENWLPPQIPFTAAPPMIEPPVEIVHWRGASGTVYPMQLHLIGTAYHPRPGIYMACQHAYDQNWLGLYVGETRSFKQRLYDEFRRHHRYARICAAKATHFCTLYEPGGKAERLRIETDLRLAFDPVCNRQ